MNVTNHIIEATGEPLIEEPNALRGDWLVLVFCLGIALGWIVGAA